MPRAFQQNEDDENSVENDDHRAFPPLRGMQLQVPKKKRRRFTIQEKLCFIRNVRKRLENGLSQRAACEELNIHHTLYGLWIKQMEEMRQSRNSKAKSLCQGRQSSLAPIQEVLLRFIFELREQGMGVSITMVMLKAAHLSREFREKSRIAQYNSARRFVRHHGMVHWIGTNESQYSINYSYYYCCYLCHRILTSANYYQS